MASKVSPFLAPGLRTTSDALAILHLRRDDQIPTLLSPTSDAITNTRFGSYPHSTLVDLPWGSQVPASKIPNQLNGKGSKASRKARGNAQSGAPAEQKDEEDVDSERAAKRVKVDHDAAGSPTDKSEERAQDQAKNITARPDRAPSGFCHILPPTPEAWTVSLPHRTQVVYTPDYSFVIQKMRVRPGSVLIEAGAGSGSFTHAAARAVYTGPTSNTKKRQGRIFSFEYHEPRATTLRREIQEHKLDDFVTVTHRDVYNGGFLLPDADAPDSQPRISPQATNIFLDLPDPSLALPHLARRPVSGAPSPLDPRRAAHITCFLPCIEQVTKCVDTLRRHAWTEISVYDLQHKRIDVRREQVGLHLEGLRGVTAVAGSVSESVTRLLDVEKRQAEFNAAGRETDESAKEARKAAKDKKETKQERLARIAREAEGRKSWKEGRLVYRTEPELKTHTSFLVFATLPREWSEVDERLARERWPVRRG